MDHNNIEKNTRLPILLWGDLIKGSKPVLRRALAGNSAHECMYSWVYLTDYLAVQYLDSYLIDNAHRLNEEKLFHIFDNKFWTIADRTTIDPNFQLSTEAFQAISFIYVICHTLPQQQTIEIVELGSTFFTSKDKFSIIKSEARRLKLFPETPSSIFWTGIDNSLFANNTAYCLHRNQQDFTTITDWKTFQPKNSSSAIFYSRFVCSYVFPDSNTFTHFLSENFSALIIEDAFSTINQDQQIFNHGQPEILFNLNQVVSTLIRNNFKVYIIESYPDFPSGTQPCHVVKLLGINNSINEDMVFDSMNNLGYDLSSTFRVDSKNITEKLNSKVSSDQWTKVKYYKSISPVWGKTPEYQATDEFSFKSKMQCIIDHLKFRFSEWGNYLMQGKMAENEIKRQLQHHKDSQ